MNVPILGLIENMSYFTCPDCGRKVELFGRSRGKEVSDAANIEYLGSIAVDPLISQLCDEGRIENYQSPEFASIVKRIIGKSKQVEVRHELRRVESSSGED